MKLRSHTAVAECQAGCCSPIQKVGGWEGGDGNGLGTGVTMTTAMIVTVLFRS